LKKIGDILLVVGGGLLFLIPATHLMLSSGIKGSGAPVLWMFTGGSAVVIGLLARIDQGATVRSIGAKISDGYKAIAILTLNALILFTGLELTAKVVFKARNLLSAPPAREPEPREKSSYYASQPWALQYWDEFASSRTEQYHAYVLWRRAPFKGTTINIDQNGIRLTPNADCSAPSFKVFTFGGSPMWGTGAPDWGTIPAYLQAALEKVADGPICVMNFAESAYVSTQSVIELLLQLQSGNVPNWVFFYDGPNDVYSGYQTGRSDVHENFDLLGARFEKRDARQSRPFMELVKSFALFSLADSLVNKLSREPHASAKLMTYESRGIDAATLSDSIVQRYLGDYKMVDALAREYGFNYVFLWAPHISTGKKPLVAEEKALMRTMDPALMKLYHLTYQNIVRSAPQHKNLYYLGNVFDGVESLLWIDDAHVTPVGNQLIAQQMLDIVTESRSFNQRGKQAARNK